MSEKTNTEKPMTWHQFFMSLGFLGVIVIYFKMPRIEVLYFRYYDEIYIGLYILIAILVALIGRKIVNNTKGISRRLSLIDEAEVSTDRNIFVGFTTDGCPVSLSNSIRTGHVQIIGSTGRGKTKSVLTAWMARDLLHGKSIILLDGKGDPEIVETIREVSDSVRQKTKLAVFDLGNPKTSVATNPLARGSAQQITDRIFTAFTFEDPYYRSVQYDITGSLIQLIHENKEIVTFQRLYELLTRDELTSALVTKSGNPALKEKVLRFLTLPRNQREQQLSGLLSQIGPFATGEIAPLVNGKSASKEAIHLSDAILKKDEQLVYVFLIPTLKYQEIGHQLGKLLLQELGWAVGERASRGGIHSFVPVYLDEFASFVYRGFTNILNKARSSQVALHLSHQSIGDLGIVSDDFANIVMSNTNVKCILGLNDPESADYIARHLGTESQSKLTERAQKDRFLGGVQKTGELSIREVEAYKVHPNVLKNLSHGRGVLHLPTRLGTMTEEMQFAPFNYQEMKGFEHE